MRFLFPTALVVAAFAAGFFTPRQETVNASPQKDAQTLRVKAIEVVNDRDEVVCTLGSFGDTAGLWVGDDDSVCLVKQKRVGAYLGFNKLKGNNRSDNGCSLAFSLDDGSPLVQIFDPKAKQFSFVDLTKLPKMAEKK